MIFRRSSADRAASEADLAEREDPYHVTQASRIYFLPNLMTAGNLCCGFVAIIFCIKASYEMRIADVRVASELTPLAINYFQYAVWLILGAGAFDALDGRLARMGGRESLFGAEFDSLADVVSFGIAPALMVFFLILSPTQGYPVFQRLGGFLSFIYLLCAAIRLARFNVITNPLLHRDAKDSHKDFVGLPVPAAAGTVASLVLALLHLAENSHNLQLWGALALPPLLALIAVLMVSTVRYPSGKQLNLQTRMKLTTFILLVAVAAVLLVFKEVGLLGCTLGYIFLGLFRQWRRTKPGRRPATGAGSV
ncbi:MAG TPA: CDP-diacylglycerol--serine O-phosphatidyltransferase [Opitutaceae bacterium]|nr:CDP-diacylglycerol--serine O-phosphatidyltransferase [Opitutaceae bacterium]